ncbi:hypothetical protein TNCV_4776151 [Trichonephila clavipes]|nr:hypothetical protein TNCV_4776151 [Trichonephila clavipes]
MLWAPPNLLLIFQLRILGYSRKNNGRGVEKRRIKSFGERRKGVGRSVSFGILTICLLFYSVATKVIKALRSANISRTFPRVKANLRALGLRCAGYK